MFKASNDISGIDKKTLPTELIPLNSIQISRGLLNYTFIQSRLDWILPFWAQEQYNPESKSFIPRSLLGLSMNITNRNWTAVGNPECNFEPIVDPRGLVTPFVNGWSIDIWLMNRNKIFSPSKEKNVKQNLVDDLPIVKTGYLFNELEVESVVSVKWKKLQIDITANGKSEDSNLIIAIRPFNPEGISLVNSIEFKENFFLVDKKKIEFSLIPDFIYCSNFECGDSAKVLSKLRNHHQRYSSFCETGLANALAIFPFKEKLNLNIECKLEEGNHSKTKEPLQQWKELINQGTQVSTPDKKLNSLIRTSLSSVLLFCDDDKITPGPFTYHQFWFRDAAYMLYALDKFGFHNFSRKIIDTFVQHQDFSGYFRSQKGEWDSNGQAIWTVYQHGLLAGDKSVLNKYFESLLKGVQWIDETRLKEPDLKRKNIFGLLPKGLSAEHVGLADYYFWDNFWSLSGIKSFISIAKLLDKNKEKNYAQSLFEDYLNDVNTSIKNNQQTYSTKSITSSATRGIDCGIIGSICASYPLQLYNPDDEKVLAALDIITDKYFFNGMFFQHFIHSGMNPYLTLQVAHSYLFTGSRKKFNEILNSVISYASSVNNYPEAIHPVTKGGCMGDGHHGWAAAEMILSIADAFAYEYDDAIYLLAGIPEEWFNEGKVFSIKNLKLKAGEVSIFCSSNKNEVELKIVFGKNNLCNPARFILKLPFKVENMEVEDKEFKDGETTFRIDPARNILKIIKHKETV